ncbi:phosphoribosylformylglycinamidine cyclo-ligase [Thermodesulforhabdus norvegica]|uniref:Phosphoribosylformylglycinamidine cyclo-ligase n=1 Tax=Thermodesulforhabdus norvegica TaxID=39841 RepID=A0A1I4VEB0_9BACT|nr:phosphoribosylformylglycinamidine cyclo-ligase [Thermodesulforhabdus norvegica]SFM99531.1 phosphoribosylformylglycinamidine cyclo-ligase [Thermodesulforhabdus norvegica]
MTHRDNETRGADLYREAGVDLEKASTLVDRIKPLAQKTYRKGVRGGIGGFGALYALDPNEVKQPLLVSSTDGVGTKLKVAFLAKKYDTVGIDLVAMCANDILVHGARPLFFLDYIAMGRIDLDVLEQVIYGIAEGCEQAGCALIGGETAEMPDFYDPGEFDMAGFIVGLVNEGEVVDGASIHFGDVIIGLESNGLHSNGYSLVRKIVFGELKMTPDDIIAECGCTVAEELLKPTRIYVPVVLKLLRNVAVKGMAHITGGGLVDNIPRVLPNACVAVIEEGSWNVPPIFAFLKERGGISDQEMYRVFNNGIGYVLFVDPDDANVALEQCAAMGIKAYVIGTVEQRKDDNCPQIHIRKRSSV